MCVPLCDGVEEDTQSILLHPLLKIYEIVDSLAIDILHHQHFFNMTIATFYFYSVEIVKHLNIYGLFNTKNCSVTSKVEFL